MAEMLEDPPGELPIVGVISLHFDVLDHALPLDTFIETSVRTKDILNDFNRTLFADALVYKIFVLTPEHGSFKNKLAIYVLSGAAAIATFAETDMGKAFVEGLTGFPPDYYFREAGRYIRRAVVDLGETRPALASKDVVPCVEDELRSGSTAILTETTKSFLQKDLVDLKKVGVDEVRFRNAYDARNKFYIA